MVWGRKPGSVSGKGFRCMVLTTRFHSIKYIIRVIIIYTSLRVITFSKSDGGVRRKLYYNILFIIVSIEIFPTA